jgi:hypothetical protein
MEQPPQDNDEERKTTPPQDNDEERKTTPPQDNDEERKTTQKAPSEVPSMGQGRGQRVSIQDSSGISNPMNKLDAPHGGNQKVAALVIPPDRYFEGKGHVQLGHCLRIHHVSNLQTTEETFDAKICCELYWWQDEVEDDARNGGTMAGAYLRAWADECPNDNGSTKQNYYAQKLFSLFVFRTAVAIKEEHNPKVFTRSATIKEKALYATKDLLLTLRQPLALRLFPFDVQHLCIPIALNHSRFHFSSPKAFIKPKAAKKMKDPGALLQMAPSANGMCEWKFYQPAMKPQGDWVQGKKHGKGVYQDASGNSCIVVFLKVSREAKPYVLRIFSVLCMIMCCTLGAFSNDVTEFDARMSYLMTLLLTAVAFQLMITNMVPKVSYLTILDEYVLSMFMVIVTPLLESALYPHLEFDESIDFYFGWIMLVLIVGIQCWFARARSMCSC